MSRGHTPVPHIWVPFEMHWGVTWGWPWRVKSALLQHTPNPIKTATWRMKPSVLGSSRACRLWHLLQCGPVRRVPMPFVLAGAGRARQALPHQAPLVSLGPAAIHRAAMANEGGVLLLFAVIMRWRRRWAGCIAVKQFRNRRNQPKPHTMKTPAYGRRPPIEEGGVPEGPADAQQPDEEEGQIDYRGC